jgi:predicted RNA-binding Zn ribbon-like protein
MADAPGDLKLVQDLLNSVDIESENDDLSGPEELGAWLRSKSVEDWGPGQDDLARVRDLRERLRDVLGSHGDDVDRKTLKALNALGAGARLRVTFDRSGTTSLTPDGNGFDGFAALIFATVHGAVEKGTWDRLKACRKESCRWAFYDTSKNRSKSWCSMSVCGNRVKAQNFRQRHSTV